MPRRPWDSATRPLVDTTPGAIADARKAGNNPKSRVIAVPIAALTITSRQFGATSRDTVDASGPPMLTAIRSTRASLDSHASRTPLATPAAASIALSISS